MDRGYEERYFGLNRNEIQPQYAGSLDPNCARDSVKGPPCIYKKVGAAKTVLLIGDSYAGQISEAVIKAARSTNFNSVIWTHGGCLVHFRKSSAYKSPDDCIYMNNEIKKWVAQNRPEVIIVSQYVRSDSPQRELRDALSTLRTMVPVILLIENHPVFPDVNDFMVERPIVMSPYNAPKRFRESLMKSQDRYASSELASWARDNRIFTMDFVSNFCKGKICTRWSDAGWLYMDVNHFSVAGAELTIPQIVAFLKRN